MRHYERLLAWRECHKLVLDVYRATERLPKFELYGVTSQTRRAALSAAVNIVEGSAKKGPAEFRRFLDISLGSLSELSYLLRVSRELGYLDEREWQELDELGNRARFLTWRLCQAVGRSRLTPHK